MGVHDGAQGARPRQRLRLPGSARSVGSRRCSAQAFDAARERAGLTLVEVYTRGREFDALYNLAEQLIEWDERVTVWRVRHFKVVSA